MFEQLLGAAKELAGVGVEDPSTAFLAAMALERFRHANELLVSDSFLEAKLAPLVLTTDGVEEFAVFGFGGQIRLDAIVSIKGIRHEVVVDVFPAHVEWSKEHYLSFDLSLTNVVCLNPAAAAGGKVAKLVLGKIPFLGPVVAGVAEYALGQAVRSVGLGMLSGSPSLVSNGVQFVGEQIHVDLSKRSDLNFL